MKAVALLVAFGIVFNTQTSTPPPCKTFISKMPSTTCDSIFMSWNKFYMTATFYFLLLEGKNLQSNKMLRAIQITDPTIKAKTLHAESIIAKLIHPNIPKLEDAIEFEGWRIQKYDRSFIDFFITNGDTLTTLPERTVQQYNKQLKDLADIIRYVNTEGYVITNLNEKSFMTGDENNPDCYFISFEETVEKGTAIDDRGDFHYWEPSRLNGEEKVWTEQADLYAFGVTLFKAFHNKKAPFVGETKEEYTKSLNFGDYEIKTLCTPEFAFIIARLLQKDPKNRLSINELIELLAYLQSGKLKKGLLNPIKINNQKPIPQELLDQLNSEFLAVSKSFNPSIDTPEKAVEKGDTNFWLSSEGIILISGLTLILLALIIWAIVSCLRKNPYEQNQIADQKLSTGLDNTKDIEGAVQKES